jgi:hypothetical protein
MTDDGSSLPHGNDRGVLVISHGANGWQELPTLYGTKLEEIHVNDETIKRTSHTEIGHAAVRPA